MNDGRKVFYCACGHSAAYFSRPVGCHRCDGDMIEQPYNVQQHPRPTDEEWSLARAIAASVIEAALIGDPTPLGRLSPGEERALRLIAADLTLTARLASHRREAQRLTEAMFHSEV